MSKYFGRVPIYVASRKGDLQEDRAGYSRKRSERRCIEADAGRTASFHALQGTMPIGRM